MKLPLNPNPRIQLVAGGFRAPNQLWKGDGLHVRRFKIVMEVTGPQGVVRKEGSVEGTNALNAVGHAILQFGVKTNDLTHLEVTLDEMEPSTEDHA